MVAKIFLVMGEMIRADIKRAHAMDFGCSNHASAEHPKYVSLKSPGLTWTLELISGALDFFYPSHARDILNSNTVFSLKQTQSRFVTSYQVKIVLDVLNLLTGVIIFVVLVLKVSF